ncbi:MAG TPA: 6-phosphogluconolactonase [Gaiellaceae bacterium]|nr:6-phosphogluconolactonase [Gaiellaceae bacterium]
MISFQVCADAEAAARAAARLLAEAAEAGGDVALSGGSTPGRAYELAAAADWSRARVWWNDERCVPPDDERSNYRLAKERLLDRLAAPPEVLRIRGELPPEQAADEYDRALEGVVLDLTLQGLGPDGHTASLFPGFPSLEERARRAVATPAGLEPFVDRVTMTIPMLNAARIVCFLVTGAEKAEIAARAFGGVPDPATPAGLVRSADGETVVVLDRAAASALDTT